MDNRHLSQLLDQAAAAPRSSRPGRRARQEPDLRRAAHRASEVADQLARFTVGRGDRVGLWHAKSLAAVTAIHGILAQGPRMYRSIPPDQPFVRRQFWPRAGSKPRSYPRGSRPPCATWPLSRPFPQLILVEDEVRQVSSQMPPKPPTQTKLSRTAQRRPRRRRSTETTWRTSCSRPDRPVSLRV